MLRSIIEFIKRLFGRRPAPTVTTRGPVGGGSGGSGGPIDDDSRIDDGIHPEHDFDQI